MQDFLKTLTIIDRFHEQPVGTFFSKLNISEFLKNVPINRLDFIKPGKHSPCSHIASINDIIELKTYRNKIDIEYNGKDVDYRGPLSFTYLFCLCDIKDVENKRFIELMFNNLRMIYNYHTQTLDLEWFPKFSTEIHNVELADVKDIFRDVTLLTVLEQSVACSGND